MTRGDVFDDITHHAREAHLVGGVRDLNAEESSRCLRKRRARTLRGSAVVVEPTPCEPALRGSDVAVYRADFPDGSLENSRWTFFNMWEPLGFAPARMPTRFGALLPLVVHPADRAALVARLAESVRSGSRDWYSEHRVVHRDGSVRWRLSRGTLLFDESGTIASFQGTEVDITQLKQTESELARAREVAEAANRAKDELLAHVSHEIRTPMNAILGMTEVALDSAPSDSQRHLLATVHSAARSLVTIVDDLLDFSKIAVGKLALDRAPFSLRAVLDDTLRALAMRAQHKGLELFCRVQPDTPDALRGDPGRLRQVLTNLVGNAIKFTPDGEVEVAVEADPSADAQTVSLCFRIRDTGIGIAHDKQATIFRPFEQEDGSTTRNFGGTGLGLTISAQLAALMDGTISVESAPGCGSTFRFTATFARSSESEAVTTRPERRVRSEPSRPIETQKVSRQPGSRAPVRVLVAEDNELNVALLQQLSRQRGYLAQFASDGRAALELAKQGVHDLLLLDLHMPELDGFAVVRAIRAHERGGSRHLPIIALTARSSALDRERCLAAGVDEFLTKPVEVAVLWAAVDRLFDEWPPARRVSRPSEPGLLDGRAILRAIDGQQSVLDKLLVVLRRSLPGQMSHIRAALLDRDFERLHDGAHQLLGTVGTFSTKTADIASALEDVAAREEPDRCAALVEQLGALCESLVVATAGLSLESLTT